MNVAVRPLTYISTCTGGGGLDAGLDLATGGNVRPVVLVEREAFAASRLVASMAEDRMALAPVWSDARTFPGRRFRGLVDGIVGGIPCQPHSLAGRRRGQRDERDLWSPTRRTLVQTGAWWILIENVPGMLSAPDEDGEAQTAGAERVWRDLHRLGFEVEGGLFSAEELGFPQERRRLFILGVADSGRHGGERPGTAGYLRGAPGAGEGGPPQWERDGHAAGDGRPDVADADEPGRRPRRKQRGDAGEEGGRRSPAGPVERQGQVLADAQVQHGAGTGLREGRAIHHGDEPAGRGGSVGNAPGERRGEGEPEPVVLGRRGSPALPGGSVADAQDRGGGLHPRQGQSRGRATVALRSGEGPLAGADGRGRDGRALEPLGGPDGRAPAEWAGEGRLYPPGPGHLELWRSILDARPDLAPALSKSDLRGMADGMADARIDWLRLLGNGVVPVVAALAFRTLALRLAARAPHAARLVRMMA